MKNYLSKTNGSNPMDIFSDAFDSFLKPLFYDEKFDSMKTDIKESESGYELEVEMPGFEKEDISLSIESGYLTISAQKKDKKESDDKQRYLRKERSVSCQRSYYIGDIKEDSVKARYCNGVLEVTLPKQEPEKPQKRTISIE